MNISVVIPVYNSALRIEELVIELSRALRDAVGDSYEIILVNDGSADATATVLNVLNSHYTHLVVDNLAVNVGQQRAVLRGFDLAKGEVIITMDDDLQQNPGDIPRFLETLRDKQVDVVIGKYFRKKHGPVRRLGTFCVKWIQSKALGIPPALDMTSFRAIRREVAKKTLQLKNPHVVVGFFLFMVTKRIVNLEVEHRESSRGRSSYSFRGLLKFFCQQILSTLVFLAYDNGMGRVILRFTGVSREKESYAFKKH